MYLFPMKIKWTKITSVAWPVHNVECWMNEEFNVQLLRLNTEYAKLNVELYNVA